MSDEGATTAVVVESVSTSALQADLLVQAAQQAELVVLPQTVRGALGVYRDSDLSMVKELREAGISVGWAHPSSERTFASQYGAEIALAVGFFIAQALGEHSVVEISRWLMAKVLHALSIRRPRGERPTFLVEVDRLKIDGDRREIEGLRIKGQDARIVDATAALLRGDPPPP